MAEGTAGASSSSAGPSSVEASSSSAGAASSSAGPSAGFDRIAAEPLTKVAVVLTEEEIARAPESLNMVSSDERKFVVPKDVYLKFDIVREAFSGGIPVEGDEFPVKCCTGALLEHVLNYLEYHRKVPPIDIPRPLPQENKEIGVDNFVDDFDKKFLTGIPDDILFSLCNASHEMGVESLKLLLAAHVASIWRREGQEKVKKRFNITKEYTHEEEEELKRKLRPIWAPTKPERKAFIDKWKREHPDIMKELEELKKQVGLTD